MPILTARSRQRMKATDPVSDRICKEGLTFAARQEVSSLYIHVPFCGGKCFYCDFYSLPRPQPDQIQAWYEGVRLELGRIRDEAHGRGLKLAPLKTLYFGGGTPSYVEPRLIAGLVREVRALFGLTADCQISLEANPESVDRPEKKEALALWREAGINRLSLGLQSASDRLLQGSGRRHTAEGAAYAIQAAWEEGFLHLALDLMTGLPGQSLEDVEASLDFIEGLPLDHLSSYALAVAEGTPFSRLQKEKPTLFPDDDLEREMTARVITRLQTMGFDHYEISNFARPGGQSRHNRVYWEADSYLAAGPAAASYMGGIRRSNPSSLEAWLDLVKDPDQGPFGSARIEEVIDEEAARIETLVLGLRLLEGVSRQRFIDRHGVDFDRLYGDKLALLEREGMLLRDEEGVRLTSRGLDFADAVARALL